MATEYGSTWVGIDDLTPTLKSCTGPVAVVYAVCRRWRSKEGGLWFDPSHGEDVLEALNGVPVPSRIASRLRAQALMDERVADCRVAVVVNQDAKSVRVDAVLVLETGSFEFVLTVNGVTAELLLKTAA